MHRIDLSEAEIRRYYENRVPKLKKRGNELRGPCPIHKGKRESLAINLETGGWFCHSGCARGGSIFDFEAELSGMNGNSARAAVLAAVGRSTEPERHIVATYDYTDEGGLVLFQTVRYHPKDFRQRRPDGRGGWIWNLMNVRLVLYRLPAVMAAPIVIVVEGEKDVDALTELGMVATTSPMGAGKWRSDYRQFLHGKQVIVIPDADEKGHQHAADVMRSLAGVAASVKLIQLPGAKDPAEWIGKGGTLEALTALVEREDSNPGPEKAKRQRRDTEEWPEPEPLDPLPAVLRFDEALLPDSLRPYVLDAAERMQIPVDLSAVVAIAALAGVVNHRAVIQPKQWDTTWTVTPNLWAALIVPSGYLKSPTIEGLTRPLRRIEKVWKEQYDQDLHSHTLAEEEYKLSVRAWEQEFIKAKKSHKKPPPRPDAIDAEPTRRRLITNDATYEKLHQLMSQNPAGLLLVKDELTGWLSRLDHEEHSAERAFALQAWNGDTPLVLDRMGRGTLDVPFCCLSVIGGITPSRLRAYLTAPRRPGLSGDGLIQRFQLAVWPDCSEAWKYIDRPPYQKAEQQASEVYERLVQMKSDEPLRLKFSPDAQELFIAWLAELETRVRGNSLPSDLNSHFAKYRSLMPSLALLFERADGGDESVSLSHTRQAAGWAEYLQSHADRIYSSQVRPEYEAAVLLSQKIRDHKADVDGVLEVRRVYRHHWEGLSSPETVKAAAEILVDFGWLREIGEPTGGRPANRYTVNPRVWK